jgi:hypothetical protein
MVYMNGQKLLDYVSVKEFNGIKIGTLESHVEALISAAYAVYKERIYTLNDYFTVKAWATGETFKLAKELKCISALELAVKLNDAIENGLVEAPCKIPLYTWTKLLAQKILRDPLARSTSKNLVKTLVTKRGIKLLKSKLTRESY